MKGICVDSSDAVYVTGSFRGLVDFDGGPGVTAGQAFGLTASYLCKYSSSGDFLWCKVWSGDIAVDDYPEVRSYKVAFGGADSLYVLGRIWSSWADLDPGPGVVGFDSGDWPNSLAYLSRFDLDGNLIWARAWEGGGEALAAGEAGEVFVDGRFSGTVAGAYLSRFDSDGNYLGAIVWDYVPNAWGSRQAHTVIVDGTEAIYIEGEFYRTIDLIPGPGKHEYVSEEHSSGFLIKLAYSGEFQWGKAWVNEDRGTSESAALTLQGNICVVGDFEGAFDPDPPSGTVLYRAGISNNWDSWLTMYDPEGNLVHGSSWGAHCNQFVYDVAVDHTGRIYACGEFHLTIDLDPGMLTDIHETTVPSVDWSPRWDAFLMRLGPDGAW